MYCLHLTQNVWWKLWKNRTNPSLLIDNQHLYLEWKLFLQTMKPLTNYNSPFTWDGDDVDSWGTSCIHTAPHCWFGHVFWALLEFKSLGWCTGLKADATVNCMSTTTYFPESKWARLIYFIITFHESSEQHNGDESCHHIECNTAPNIFKRKNYNYCWLSR